MPISKMNPKALPPLNPLRPSTFTDNDYTVQQAIGLIGGKTNEIVENVNEFESSVTEQVAEIRETAEAAENNANQALDAANKATDSASKAQQAAETAQQAAEVAQQKAEDSANQVDSVVGPLNDKVDQEIKDRKAADDALQSLIENKESSLNAKIEAEQQARESEDSAINKRIDDEISAREQADNEINDSITTLQNKDTALDGDIKALQDKDTSIDAQIKALQGKDTEIDTAIESEASAREAADAVLQNNIETTKQELQEQITANKDNITSLQSEQNVQNTRLQSIETEQQEQNTRLGTLETQETTQNQQIADLQSRQTTLKQDIDDLTDNFNPFKDGVSKDIAALKAKDTEHDTEIEALQNEDTAINNRIDDEISAREQADNGINDSITALQDKDTEIDTAIESEVSARETADATLQQNIEKTKQELQEQITSGGQSTTELTSRVDTLENEHDSDEARIESLENAQDTFMPKSGGDFTGAVTVQTPIENNQPATKEYVDMLSSVVAQDYIDTRKWVQRIAIEINTDIIDNNDGNKYGEYYFPHFVINKTLGLVSLYGYLDTIAALTPINCPGYIIRVCRLPKELIPTTSKTIWTGSYFINKETYVNYPTLTGEPEVGHIEFTASGDMLCRINGTAYNTVAQRILFSAVFATIGWNDNFPQYTLD